MRSAYMDEDGQSLMPDYTERMTTRELINLVTFLEAQYEVVVPEYPRNFYPYGIDFVP